MVELPEASPRTDPTAASGARTGVAGPSPAALEAAVESEVRSRLARRFVRGNRNELLGHMLAATAVAWIFWGSADRMRLASWLILLYGSFLLRHLVVWSAHRRLDQPEVVFRRIFLAVILVALSWGAGAWVLPGASGTSGLGVAAILFAGLVGVASATLSSHPPSFLVYSGILVAALTVAETAPSVSLQTQRAAILPLSLVLLFWAAMIAVHRNAYSDLVHSLRAAVQLEWSERREALEREVLEGLLRSAPGAVLVLDREERILRVNSVAARMAGRSEEELEGTSLAELLEGTVALAPVREVLAEAWEQGHARGEVSFTPGDGRTRWYRVSVSRGSGSVEGAVFLQGENVTSLKEAEAARREAEDLYRGLVESAGDLVWRVDLEGRWTFLNQASLEIYGLPPEEMLGRPIEEVQVPERMQADREALLRVLGGEELWDHETLHRDVQGNLRRLAFHARRVVDAEGRVVGAQGTARDVTQRAAHREALERVAEQAELIRSLLNASRDLIFIKDAQGVYRGCNDAFARHLGRPEEEIIGRGDEDLYPDWLAAAFRESDRTLFSTGGSRVEESWEEGPDGELRLLQTVKTALFASDGTPRGIIGISRDLTEIRRQEERSLELAREAERASAMKTAFLANMSHEIRTPMNGVLGMTELLLDSGLTAEQRRYAEVVRSSAESLLGILNDVLDISKIEAGRLELEEIPFDLHEAVAGSVRILGVEASRKGNELVVDIQPEVPQAVLGDPARLRQVLTNLAGNAVKFTRDGEIVVRVGVTEDAGELRWLRFEVEDTGTGIPEDKLETIFEEFQQADVSTTRLHGGTGLGLSISRRLVRLMGGDLGVRSEEGKGSIFSFTIPMRLAPEGALEPGEGRRSGEVAGSRVLVVDDNATNRKIVRDFLQRAGARVEEREDADGAMSALRDAVCQGSPFRLVVLDVQMPDKGGVAFLEELRRDPEVAGTRVLVLGSGSGPQELARARLLGVHGFLQKPITRGELVEAASAALAPHHPGEDDPRPVEAPPVRAPGDFPTEGRGGPLILVAEDNLVNRQVVEAMLTRRGYRVALVENGSEAVSRAREERPGLVLMDVQMPVMDGIEATRRLRADPGLEGLPVVALTAHALEDERERCRDAGMNDFLSKPFRPRDLFAMVERWAGPPLPPAPADPAIGEAGLPGAEIPDHGTRHAPPVDLDAFRAIMREAGVESVVEPTLEVFRAESGSRMEDILQAWEGRDLRALASAAHAYKSMAGSIRAHGLHRLLEELEERARRGDGEAAAEGVRAVEREHRAVREHLDGARTADR